MRATRLPATETGSTVIDEDVGNIEDAAKNASPTFYRLYDRQQRLQLTTWIAAFLLVFFSIATLIDLLIISAYGIWRDHLLLAAGSIGIGIFSTILFWICWRLAQREQLFIASGLIITCSLMYSYGISIGTVFTATTPALIGCFSLSICIIIAAMLGNRWLLGSVALANSILVVIIATIIIPAMPHQVNDTFPQSLPILIGILILQWSLALLIGAGMLTYRQAYQALGEAYTVIERAKQLDDLKDQFISSVNHELRNPIMAMMNYVTVLNQRHETMPAPRRTQILHSLDETGKRVIQLIGSILDVRVLAERPKDFTPKAVNILASIQTSATLIDPSIARMDERNLFIRVPADLEVWGNEIYLQQICTNLLSNAVKYSTAGTSIEINAQLIADTTNNRSTAQVSQHVEITLRDFGLGIPKHQIPLLFNRFVRLPRDLTSQTTGSGLGLYLCKVLTEAMGGRIWVESSGIAGEGSVFHIVLPTVPVVETAESVAIPAITVQRPSFTRLLTGGIATSAGRVRVVIGVIVALFLVLSGVLGFVQSRSLPSPTFTGLATFYDGPAGPSSVIHVRLNGLSEPTNGDSYRAWLIDTSKENILSLGSLNPQGTFYSLNYISTAVGSNLLSVGNLLEITLEHSQSQALQGKVIVQGTFPPLANVHIQHLLLTYPSTPNQTGLLIGLRNQAHLLDIEAHQAENDIKLDPAQEECLILSMLGIVETPKDYPLPITCQVPVKEIGDGYGMLTQANSGNSEGSGIYTSQYSGYLPFAAAHTSLAIQQNDSTSLIHFHGERLINNLNLMTDWMHQLTLDLDALNTTPNDTTKITALVTLADNIYQGTSVPGSGALGIYTEGQMLSSIQLTEPSR